MSLETLSTATSPRLLAERTRGRRCLGNAGMPSNKSVAGVTCLAQTNLSVCREAGQFGPKSASLRPPSPACRSELITVIAVGELPSARGLGLGAGHWAGPERLSRQGREAGPSCFSNLTFASIIVIKALIKRLLCTNYCKGGGPAR